MKKMTKMSVNQDFSNYFLTALVVFTVMIMSRLIPHPWNFTAIGAGSFLMPLIFSRAGFFEKLNSKFSISEQFKNMFILVFSLAFSLTALLVSDLILGFYEGVFFVYLATSLCLVLGFFFQETLADVLSGRKTVTSSLKIAGGQGLGSLLFYVLTNFAVWLHLGMYPKTLAGLFQCYMMALPFLKWQLLGDLFYLSILIGGIKVVKYFPYYTKRI
jgi:hypothetical protein